MSLARTNGFEPIIIPAADSMDRRGTIDPPGAAAQSLNPPLFEFRHASDAFHRLVSAMGRITERLDLRISKPLVAADAMSVSFSRTNRLHAHEVLRA